ncbi:Spore germination protein A1 [compost metagenome]
MIPSESMGIAGRLIRFMLMTLGGTFGFFGIMAGLMILLAHVSALHSFGVPYMSPLSPLQINSLKDVFIRAPWWAMNRRPGLYDRQGTKREATEMEAADQGHSQGNKEGGEAK